MKLLGIDNGWKKSTEKFQSNSGTTFMGRTLMIVQSKNKKGSVKIMASGDGLTPETISININ